MNRATRILALATSLTALGQAAEPRQASIAPAPLPTARVPAIHWSFQLPQRAALPKVRDKAWPRNSVDAFVLARLEHEKIEPAPEADRRTLIRRLSLDLLGLPPTPEEVAEFLGDQRADAYEQLVDRLLSAGSGVDSMRLHKGQQSSADQQRIVASLTANAGQG